MSWPCATRSRGGWGSSACGCGAPGRSIGRWTAWPCPTGWRSAATGRAAATAWRRLGCPYEEALALAQGDRPAQLRALDILTGLGAAPAAAMVRRNLRAEGARGIPRGPRAATRHNPLGLTARQVDILALLAEDLSNKEIAARLRIAPKTVDHHVCAILAKLEVVDPQAGGQAPRHARIARQT